ncbi:MAG: hypothetical protein PHC86_09015 [Eubacteriales bacterium]|nr:hypothetical protein [Eubacteriales bacterium]
MEKGLNRMLMLMSVLIAILAAGVSLGGLFIKGLYHDNPLVIAAWQGNDIVTLYLMVPLMLIALAFLKKSPNLARLFWIGSLWYMIYNYLFYLFGAAFNNFFLLYIAIFTLSVYTMIFALINTNANAISQSFSAQTPVRWISGFMIFFAVLIGTLWIMMALSFVFTGVIPQSIVQTDHPTGVVFATDLSLLIPALLFSAILLWKKAPWGYVLSAIVLVKATAYGLVLLIMSVVTFIKLGLADPFIILWSLLTLGCLLSLIFLLGNLKKRQ